MSFTDPDRIELTFSMSRRLDGADEIETEGLTFWSVSIALIPDDEDESSSPRRVIGDANVVLVDSTCPDPWDACDAASSSLEALASAVWTPDGDLSPAVEEAVDYLGGDIMLLDRIELAPDARGSGLGLLCAAEIIRVLGRGCHVVATQAMPVDRSDLSELDVRRGSAALTRLWTRLGLHPLRGFEGEGMLVGDLTTKATVEAREAIRAEADLA